MSPKFKNLLVVIALVGIALASSACTQTVSGFAPGSSFGHAPVDYDASYSAPASSELPPLYSW